MVDTTLRSDSIIRAQVAPSTQTRIWKIVKVNPNTAVIQLAWEDDDHKAPNFVLGKEREVSKLAFSRISVLDLTRYK